MKECLSAATEYQNDWYNNCYLETGFYQRGLGMSTGLFFRGFCGFALQLVPSTLFMLNNRKMLHETYGAYVFSQLKGDSKS